MSITENLDATAARMTRDEAKVLAHYAAGETVDQIFQSTPLARADIVLAIDALAKNNRGLARNLAMAWQKQHPEGARPGPAPVASHHAAAKATDGAPPPPAPAAAPADPDTIEDLLARAIKTGVPKLVRAADRIHGLLGDLQQELGEHEKTAELRAEADELSARLAAIQRQLKPPRGALTAAAVQVAAADGKAVRAWAASQGIDCPARGRIPRTVLDAYQQRGGA